MQSQALGNTQTHQQPPQLPTAVGVAVPASASTSTLAGCLSNWYTNHIWQTVQGMKEQNQRAEAKAAVNIMMVLYQKPFQVPEEPPRTDVAAFKAWKHEVWELAIKLDTAANQRLHAFDKKKPTRKASSLRKRWRLLHTSHPEAYRSLGAQYLALKSSGSIVDACTPPSHLWAAVDLD
eukprot:jgi/Phyca11/133518/e_gw1.536.3.1